MDFPRDWEEWPVTKLWRVSVTKGKRNTRTIMEALPSVCVLLSVPQMPSQWYWGSQLSCPSTSLCSCPKYFLRPLVQIFPLSPKKTLSHPQSLVSFIPLHMSVSSIHSSQSSPSGDPAPEGCSRYTYVLWGELILPLVAQNSPAFEVWYTSS